MNYLQYNLSQMVAFWGLFYEIGVKIKTTSEIYI